MAPAFGLPVGVDDGTALSAHMLVVPQPGRRVDGLHKKCEATQEDTTILQMRLKQKKQQQKKKEEEEEERKKER